MEAQDHYSWLTLVLGALLGLFGSIIANLIHDRLLNFLETRKISIRAARRSKALREYARYKQLYTGERDKYLFLIRDAATLVILLFLAILLLILGNMALTMIPQFISVHISYLLVIVLLTSSTIILGILIRYMQDFMKHNAVFSDFTNYESQIRKRYPEAFTNDSSSP
jgi:hypothetical protein